MGEYLFRRWRVDGWPICPNCEEDRLHSLRSARVAEVALKGDFACRGCGWETRGHRHEEPPFTLRPTWRVFFLGMFRKKRLLSRG